MMDASERDQVDEYTESPCDLGFLTSSSIAVHNRDFTLISQNARSVRANGRKIKELIMEISPSVVCLQENWGNTLSITGYRSIDLFRKSRGGGVSILFSTNCCNLEKSGEIMHESIELLCAVNKKIAITNVYRPPKGNFQQFLTRLKDHLETISDRKIPHYVLGDFNIDLLDENNRQSTLLTDVFLDNNLQASVKMATRICNGNGTII